MYRLVMDEINSKIKLSLVFSRGGKSAQDPSITTGRSCIFSLETSGTAIYERKCWIFVKTDPLYCTILYRRENWENIELEQFSLTLPGSLSGLKRAIFRPFFAAGGAKTRSAPQLRSAAGGDILFTCPGRTWGGGGVTGARGGGKTKIPLFGPRRYHSITNEIVQ